MNKSASFLLLTLAVLLIRLWSLDTYPLTDTTEARYGDIARVMVETNNWITPQVTDGHPFWAKPPLSFWQSAMSIKLLGLSEFSVRLPSLLNYSVILVLVFVMATPKSREIAPLAVFISVTAWLGFIVSGGVMTDIAMVVGTTLTIVAFWQVVTDKNKIWGYLFFVGLCIGMLAKGPVSWIVCLFPIVLWTLIYRKSGEVLSKLPMIEGIAIVCLVALPWFLVAELETPGFLEYYFIGEHIQRYIDGGWQGDLYGTAHEEPYGSIWMFAFLAFAPWSLLVVWHTGSNLLRGIINFRKIVNWRGDGYTIYLLIFAFWPIVFFTFAGNILHTYVLPSIPALAVLTACVLNNKRHTGMFVTAALALPLVAVVATPLGITDTLNKRSHAVTHAIIAKRWPDSKIVYVGDRPHSGRFYSNGQSVLVRSGSELEQELSKVNKAVLLVGNSSSMLLNNTPLQRTEIVDTKGYSGYLYDISEQ